MQTFHRPSSVPIQAFKRTKIIATIGPSTDSSEAIRSLIAAGANGLQLDFSHGTEEEWVRQIKWIRQAAQELEKPVAIIQTLEGPAVRLGDFSGVIPVQTGQSLRFAYNVPYITGGPLPTQYDLSRKVKRGERLYLYDGKVHAQVTSVQEGIVHVRVENDGILIKQKTINLPDTDFDSDSITAKDRQDLVFGSTHHVDYVMANFVRTAKDITRLRRLLRNLGSQAKIIAKIGSQAAVEQMAAIIEASDGVMVAGADLATEAPLESIPTIQRQIIDLGLKFARPTIVATQLLASLVESAEPSQSEVSDVVTAVLGGADTVMLSEQTAKGRHPIETVQMVKRIIRYTEENAPLQTVSVSRETPSHQDVISHAAIRLAWDIGAKAIVAETKSGATALRIAARRPAVPVIAVTRDPRTARQLAIVYGIKSYVRPASHQAANKLTDWLRQIKILHKGDIVVTASGQYPGVIGSTDTIQVRVLE